MMIVMMLLASLTGCTHQQQDEVFVYGDTTFNMENDEADVNPHRGYSGWACIRYGIGETLFRYSDEMQLEPWLATEYENLDVLNEGNPGLTDEDGFLIVEPAENRHFEVPKHYYYSLPLDELYLNPNLAPNNPGW